MLNRDEDILKAAEDWQKAGHGVALATVVETWGSAPRPAFFQSSAALRMSSSRASMVNLLRNYATRRSHSFGSVSRPPGPDSARQS